MSTEYVFDAFVSYSWAEPAKSWVRKQLVPALENAGLRVCLDVEEFEFGGDLVLEMDRTLRQSRRAICVITPRYFDGNRNTLFEALFVHRRDPAGLGRDLIPLVLVEPERLPDWIAGRIRLDWTSPDEIPSQWRKLLKFLGAKDLTVNPPGLPPAKTRRLVEKSSAAGHDGILPRAVVFGSENIPGQEYTIEILTAPVVLRRNEHGGVTVRVNRDGVAHALASTAGKRKLCLRAFNSAKKIAAARRLDAAVHRFLLGHASGEGVLRLDDFPLRWASGGVFSVVRWRGRRWTPFFFRDIPPYGWNIALGSSERGDDLNDPWTFLIREFLEETLVLSAAPRPGLPLDFKRFVFDRLYIGEENRRAEAFAAVHVLERYRRDRLLIRATAEPGRLPELDALLSVDVDLLPTQSVIEVAHAGQTTACRNVLVCINLLELGIEVVKIAEYALADGDVILDGELLPSLVHPELVRMPMALIAHDHLSRAFQDQKLRYVRKTQPSVEAPPIPPDSIHLFEFDARRRRELVTAGDGDASAWERERYTKWLKGFGGNFFDRAGNVSNHHPCSLFTPASAKIASYYFAQALGRSS
jgi:hypothetical protein